MERILTLKQIARACNGEIYNCEPSAVVSDVITDSRKTTENSVFIALRGERFDGHNFVKQVTADGAVCSVVDKGFENKDGLPVIVVENTLRALQAIAKHYRLQFGIPAVAITGSVGKTSTKDMVASVLQQHYKTLKTNGNFNNEIGLPLTALRLSREDEIAVFEMGMSSFGEISRLSGIAAPETAIITNIGYSHIENLKTRENILKAKLEILDGLAQDGTVIMNGDDPYLRSTEGTLPFETLYYGIENTGCDLTAYNIKKYSDSTEFDFRVDGTEYKAVINVPGEFHIYNALAAILTGIKYNIPIGEIIKGIAAFEPGGMRQCVEKTKSFVLIKDCYNASPTSMKSGLEVLAVTQPKNGEKPFRRVAVLGDMLELGEYAERAHREVGELVCNYNLGCLVVIGKNAEYIAKGAIEKGFGNPEIYMFYDNNAAKAHIMEVLKPNDVILFKGSRGMRLEEVADYIEEKDC